MLRPGMLGSRAFDTWVMPHEGQIARNRGDCSPGRATETTSYDQTRRISHTYVDLIQRRTGECAPAGQTLRGMTDHLVEDGWGCPSA
jgi:hypothetical protein